MRRLSLLIVLLLTACGSTRPAAPVAPTAAGGTQSVTIAMPFIPNVQFAYYYYAEKLGYYAEEGIEVNFDYNFETDVVARVAQGSVQFGMASGDSVLLARAQELPVVMVATINQEFPTVIFSKADQGITTPADLKGKTLGIPGRFGAGYIGLRALMRANGLTEQDVTIQEIGFTQLVAVSEDKVQAATGYGNNEPLQLARSGVAVNVLRIEDSYTLASDGIIVNEQLIASQPDLVRGFVRATLRGMRATINQQDESFTTTLGIIPELAAAPEATRALQREVLRATLPFWQSGAAQRNGLGYSDLARWRATHTFLRESGLLTRDVAIENAFTNTFVR